MGGQVVTGGETPAMTIGYVEKPGREEVRRKPRLWVGPWGVGLLEHPAIDFKPVKHAGYCS